MSQPSLITSVLEEEIKEKLRKYGIVVWLDKDKHYSAYVDNLVDRYTYGDFFAPVVAFRGSFLEMLLALEPYNNREDPDRLLIHMPGHTEESVRQTPILELYHAGYRYRKALDTLIREATTGRVNPAEIEHYLCKGLSDLTAAEQWLENASQPQDSLASYLESLSLEWIVDGMFGEGKVLQSRVYDAATVQTLADYLHRHTGMNGEFLRFFQGNAPLSFSNLSEVFAAWLMCVEYVHDLARSPHIDILKPLKQLSTPLLKTCEQLIHYLRQRYADTYVAIAQRVESDLQLELDAISAEDLGRIDTFQREETAVLEGALQALLAGDWEKVLHWAKLNAALSFWLQRDPTRRLVWSLVGDAARLAYLIQSVGHPLKTATNLREALEYYTQYAYEVDRAHRSFEQQRLKLLEPTLPHFTQLLDAADRLRSRYRAWADELAENFANLCTTEGFLPEANLQQRTLYDQVIHPLTQSSSKVAYFLIDAFRYEMATELLHEFEGAGTTVTLKARYAELPSITAVGMNALAPVCQSGRLVLAGDEGFKGFRTGEYIVQKPDERVRAISDKSVNNNRGVRALNLLEVCNRSTTSLKQSCSGANLIVVHSKEIDDAGEANVGIATFETWLQQIKSAWNHLKSIGINEFVFTADHGFLLQDQTTRIEKYQNATRRYFLSQEPRSEDKIATVSLKALNYEGQESYLLFRKDTAVFATGNPSATFVHGGNSLQERVIPVLSVSHRHQSNLAMVKYLIEATPERELLGFSRIQLCVKPAPLAQGVLSFVAAKSINLALRVPSRPDIQITIKDAPGAEVKNQQLQIAVEAWIEVLFDLKGQRDERVRVEVFHPDGVEDVEPTISSAYFNVSGLLQGKAPIATSSSADWQDSFEDQAVRSVFLHLQQHSSITELELNQMLGSARRVRRFALEFEEYLKQVPFSVKIETTSNGKRYVKQYGN